MSNIRIFVSHRIDIDSETVDTPVYFPVRCGAVYDESNSEIRGDDGRQYFKAPYVVL